MSIEYRFQNYRSFLKVMNFDSWFGPFVPEFWRSYRDRLVPPQSESCWEIAFQPLERGTELPNG